MLLTVHRRLIATSNGVPVKPAWVIERYKMRAEDLRTRFIDATGTKPFEMSASKFKTLMEMNGVAQKREGHAFVGTDWSVSEVTEVRMHAGSYYTGLRPKTLDEL